MEDDNGTLQKLPKNEGHQVKKKGDEETEMTLLFGLLGLPPLGVGGLEATDEVLEATDDTL